MEGAGWSSWELVGLVGLVGAGGSWWELVGAGGSWWEHNPCALILQQNADIDAFYK